MRKHYDKTLSVTWKNFQLEQVNGDGGAEWKVWEQPNQSQGRSLLAAMAGEAARRQGSEAFERFHLALLTARHGAQKRVPLNQEDVLLKMAEDVGLDTEQFRDDLGDRSILKIIGRDHIEAVENHGIFGTPTFVFENGNSVYMKSFIPPEDDSVTTFEHFLALMAERAFVGELKRPQPPWPKGALK